MWTERRRGPSTEPPGSGRTGLSGTLRNVPRIKRVELKPEVSITEWLEYSPQDYKSPPRSGREDTSQ